MLWSIFQTITMDILKWILTKITGTLKKKKIQMVIFCLGFHTNDKSSETLTKSDWNRDLEESKGNLSLHEFIMMKTNLNTR